MTQVRLFGQRPGDGDAWDAFVAANADATSDHVWAWRKILKDTFGYRPHYLGAVDSEDHLQGILPLFQVPRGFGRTALSSIPFGNYGGVCADTPEAGNALLDAAKALLEKTRGEYIDLRHRSAIQSPYLREQRLYNRFTMPILGDMEEHMRQMGQNNRKKIGKAKRRGLTVESSRDVNALYRIHTHTSKRLGTPCFPKRYFQQVMQAFGDRADIFFIVAGGRMVSYDLVIFFKQTMVIQFGGTLSKYFRDYPNNLHYSHALEVGLARGMKELDYCRNRADSGAAHFKRMLHLQEAPLAYQYYLPEGKELPERNPSNPKYQLAIRAWQRLPLALTQWIGPPIVRFLA